MLRCPPNLATVLIFSYSSQHQRAWLTASAAVWRGSGFQPLKRCRHFGSTWNRYTAIKTGDCALTACHVHLTWPHAALMFTREGADDLQPDTLSRRTQFLILYRAGDTILHQQSGSGEITWCIGKYWQHSATKPLFCVANIGWRNYTGRLTCNSKKLKCQYWKFSNNQE